MNEIDEKELRNKRIIDMHNSGENIKAIIKATGMSKSGIYKVIGTIIKSGEIAPKEPIKDVKLTGDEEVFKSFVGYERTSANVYVHKETGELVEVAFVRATEPGEFGYFVKLKKDFEKSTASGNEIK